MKLNFLILTFKVNLVDIVAILKQRAYYEELYFDNERSNTPIIILCLPIIFLVSVILIMQFVLEAD